MVRTFTSFIFGVTIVPSVCSTSMQRDAAPAELAGERKPDRPAADDQDRDSLHSTSARQLSCQLTFTPAALPTSIHFLCWAAM